MLQKEVGSGDGHKINQKKSMRVNINMQKEVTKKQGGGANRDNASGVNLLTLTGGWGRKNQGGDARKKRRDGAFITKGVDESAEELMGIDWGGQGTQTQRGTMKGTLKQKSGGRQKDEKDSVTRERPTGAGKRRKPKNGGKNEKTQVSGCTLKISPYEKTRHPI